MLYKIIGLIMLLGLPLLADLSIGQMEAMVEKIKAKRVGVKIDKDPNFVSPFVLIQEDKNVTVYEKPKSKNIEFVLGGIINNRAYLNEKWVQKGDIVEGYEVTEIGEKSVTLIRGDRTIKVFLKKKSKSILQLNEG